MRLLTLCLALSSLFYSQNKIVYIMTQGRCLSTIAFRMFENRDDFVGFHEPTRSIFNKRHYLNKTEGNYREDAYKNYDEMISDFLSSTRDSHVIVKDTLSTARDLLSDKKEFLERDDVHFILLVRHPYSILNSIYKVLNGDDGSRYYGYGLQDFYHDYLKLKDLAKHKIHFISSEELSRNPKKVLRGFCDEIGIDFSEKMLSWDFLDESFTGESWHDQKTPERVQRFHKNAMRSTSIRPLPEVNVPCDDDLYSHIEDEKDREMLKALYLRDFPYYQKLVSELGRN